MTRPWRWLLGSAAVLAIAGTAVAFTSGCSSCDEPPPEGCYGPPGATHQEACAACAAGYTGCREGKWVMIPCAPVTPPPRDGGRQ